ncbi:MAG: hypothetical protein AABZ47_09265 [Planctomycetota bacterium]
MNMGFRERLVISFAVIEFTLVAAWLIGLSGCIHGHCRGFLYVEGVLLDGSTGEPIVGAFLGGTTFTESVETDSHPPVIFDGGPGQPPSDARGRFRSEFATSLGGCDPPPEFPMPDQVEIVVVRDGCEQRFMFLIDINEETVVDLSAPDDILQLREPILVPACP